MSLFSRVTGGSYASGRSAPTVRNFHARVIQRAVRNRQARRRVVRSGRNRRGAVRTIQRAALAHVYRPGGPMYRRIRQRIMINSHGMAFNRAVGRSSAPG